MRARIAAAAWILSATASSAELSGAQALDGLQRWLDGTRDLRGRFTQRLVSGALGAGLEESGRLWVARPGRMRWDYTDPEAKIAIVRDGATALYLAEERQLIRGRLEDGEDWLPALLGGTARLAEVFDPVGAPRRISDDALELRIVPRGAAEAVVHLTLGLRLPELSLESVEILDPAGNRTLYRFSSLERNRGVAASRFTFEPPPGTEIVGAP